MTTPDRQLKPIQHVYMYVDGSVEEVATQYSRLEVSGEVDTAGCSQWRVMMAEVIGAHLGVELSEDQVQWLDDLLWYAGNA
jgi:hypothetical protein